jgi:hypothetical protein
MATATATSAKPSTRRASGKAAAAITPAGENPVTAFLDSYNFTYEFIPALDLSKVNREQSKLNQARIAKPINEEQALMYAVAMEKGDKFPPIVVSKQRGKSGDEFIVMDGNHRVYAADQLPLPTLPAYVVKDPSPAEVRAFTYAANTKHGLPTSLSDRLRQATHLVDEGKATQSTAARELGVPLHQLRHYMEGWSATKRFTELGQRKYDVIHDTARRKLNTIRSNIVLKAVADLFLEASLSAEDLGDLIRRVNTKREQRDQVAVVEGEREKRKATIKATAGGRLAIPQVFQTFARTTSMVLNIDEAKLMSGLTEIPDESREEYGRAASEAGARLMELGMLLRRNARSQ